MIINVHAGHNPDGMKACGAIGLIYESTEARKVKDIVITKLKALGHTVYDTTVNDGTSQNDVLSKIIAKCNAHKVDIDVSIHFNSGAKDTKGNSKTTGVEVLIASTTSKAKETANTVASSIATLGYKNRGVKVRSDLAFLKKTTAPALLIECCFGDDKDDVKLYNAESMANAIVRGITGVTAVTTPNTSRYYPKYTGKSTSIVDALKSVGEKDTSLAHRKRIAQINKIGITNSITMNLSLLVLLKEGKLIKC